MELDRKIAHDPKNLLKWYERLRKIIIEYGIQKKDCYNYDESSFRIGIGDNQWIITFNFKMPAYTLNQQVRDLVTCGETISVDGNKLPPIIILPAI